MVKVIKLYYDDRVIVVQKGSIALLEAHRRAKIDEDESPTNIKKEYDNLMEDDYDVYDYIVNNMDWEDLEPFVINVFMNSRTHKQTFTSGDLLDYKDTNETNQFYDY